MKKRKTKVKIVTFITLLLTLILQNDCGNNTVPAAPQEETSTSPVSMSIAYEQTSIFATATKAGEILQAMQQSANETDGNDIILLPPQKNINLESANFIVTDNRGGGANLLGYQSSEVFLEDFGFGDKEPFYQYFDEDSGTLQLELYYDEYYGTGGGVRYYSDKQYTSQIDKAPEGFLFNSSDKLRIGDTFFTALQERASADPYAMSSPDGYDSAQDTEIEHYQEERKYATNGKPQHYLAQGQISYMDEEGSSSNIVEIDWDYRENGSLKQRSYRRAYSVYDTSNSIVQGYYDTQERVVFEDAYITHGSLDYYYIYMEDSPIPDYYLYIDHNLDRLCVEFLSCNDIAVDEQGKQYGIIGPSLYDNLFVQAVKAEENYSKSENVTHTYAADYDGDGSEEAFVIIGEWSNPWAEPTLEMITGELWFVDSGHHAERLRGTTTFLARQQYIRQDGRIYLFLHHDIGLPWITDVVSIRNNQVVDFTIGGGSKHINKDGQVIITQDTYDSTIMIGMGVEDGKYIWVGHTWKPYTFEFNHEQWKEISAREVTREEVEAIAAIPELIDTEEYDSVQYILRDNGELNINKASFDSEYECIDLQYSTYRLGETQEWILVDSDLGFYRIQLGGESHWDYLDNLMANE